MYKCFIQCMGIIRQGIGHLLFLRATILRLDLREGYFVLGFIMSYQFFNLVKR